MVRFRVYAVTGKNKLLCSPLFLLITMQPLNAMTTAIIFLRLPGGPFDTCSLTPVDGHSDRPLPAGILNLFSFCTCALWKPGVLAYAALVLAFGVFSPSCFDVRRSKNSYVLRYRYPCLLDSRLYGQERAAAYILGDEEPLGCHSAGCNVVLHDHIFHSTLCPVVPVCRYGKCYVVC